MVMAKNRASLEPKPSSDANHSSCDDVSLEKWSSLKSDCAQTDLTIGVRTIWKLFIVATTLGLACDQHVTEYKKDFNKLVIILCQGLGGRPRHLADT